ncbi:hypothetical protein ATCC90586_006167 [Pythium insidiosum]|nr:hypothetical protein ATCC90586_006167 [Pythium insidiosum]
MPQPVLHQELQPLQKAKSLTKGKKKPVTEGLVVHDLTELAPPRGVRTIVASEGRDAAIRECRRKVEKISRECRMDNVKYRDPHFDLSTMSTFCLHGLRQDKEDAEGVSEPGAAKRVGDIYDKPQFYVDGIDAGDIKQGGAGDCWFLAAIATIANMPSLLESICVARDEQVGVYGFIFFRDGEWISEVIDDQLFITHPNYSEAEFHALMSFPTEKQYVEALQRGSNALHFAKCADSNETWLPLLEKAYAKAHGDYSSIEGGFTGEGVEDLTGGVTSEIVCEDILDRDRFWREELTKVNKELLFACAISGVRAFSVQGIIVNHAYSVLKAVEVNGQRFVQVRNPWGQCEWTGAWSDGSPEWTPEWMTLLGHKFGDDGAFWMSYDDFLKTFTTLDRTRIFTADWSLAQAWTQAHVEWPATFIEQEFRITTTTSGPVVIVLQQADGRYFVGLDGQYDFRLHFRVRREGEREYYARSKQTLTMARSVNKEIHLEPGTWRVSFKVSLLPTDRKRRAEYIESYKKERSDKFLVVARNFDYAFAKGANAAIWEDEDGEEKQDEQDTEEKPHEAKGKAPKAKPAKSGGLGASPQVEEEQEPEGEDDSNQTDEKEDQEGANADEEGEEQTQAEEGQEEGEEDEEEEDHSDEDTTVVLGVRVHAMDPNLQVEVVAPEKDMEQEFDPDDSSVVAFLAAMPNKEGLVSSSFRQQQQQQTK